LAGGIEVRRAAGTEDYLTFGGETEHPAPGEVIFADEAGRAHARRWTNRQSAWSGVTGQTSAALIVAEALHPSAAADVAGLAETEAVSAVLAAARVARVAARQLSSAPDGQLDEALRGMSAQLERRSDEIAVANEQDVRAARANGLPPAMIDRLLLDTSRVRAA